MKSLFALLVLLVGMPAAASSWDLASFGLTQPVILVDDDPAYALPGHDDSAWPARRWQAVTERGVWWLRGRVEMPQRYLDSGVPVGLYISAAAAVEVWWDGQPIGHMGRVGSTREQEVPGPIDAVIPVPADARVTGEHLLAIRFSSQYAGPGINTPVDALYFAPFGSPLRPFQQHYQPSLVLGGALTLAMIFLAVLWLRGREADLGWLLLACTGALLQLGFEVSRAFVQYPYPWHEGRLHAIGAAAALGGIGLLGHFVARFELAAPWAWCVGVAAAAAVLMLSGLPIGLATVLIIIIWLSAGMVACAIAIRRGHASGVAGFAALALMLGALLTGPVAFTDRTYFIGLVIILLIVFADSVRSHARTRQERDAARHRSARLELELLKRQIRPHFLMNTLTTIQEWLETDPGTANAMIDALAAEFRLLDRLAEQRLIPLEDELALCRAHLAVVSYRQERAYRLDVHGDTGLQLPPAIIHTLLENAITHAGHDAQEVAFDLSIRHQPKSVALTLSSPGDAAPPGEPLREGTGLGYVRARLREAFGDAATVCSGPTAAGWQTFIEMPSAVGEAAAGPSERVPAGFAR